MSQPDPQLPESVRTAALAESTAPTARAAWRRWRRPVYVLRLGRHTLDLWRDAPGGLQRIASQPAPVEPAAWLTGIEPKPDPLQTALITLLQTCPEPARLDVIVESAWMPVSLLATGSKLWSAQQIQTLARHRLTTVYGPAVQGWTVQSSYLTGDAQALVFGLPDALRRLLDHVATAPHTKLHPRLAVRSIQPAVAWGWDRWLVQSRHPSPSKNFWWVWPEQDRNLITWFALGTVSGLNPGASSAASTAAVSAQIAFESARLGVMGHDAPILAATWAPNAALDSINSIHGLASNAAHEVDRPPQIQWQVIVDSPSADHTLPAQETR